MGQIRRFEYLDDDATEDIIRWLLGMFPNGRYYGWDFVPSANLTLGLNHATTGISDVDGDGVATNKYGHIVTPQGVFIKDDTALALAITATTTHPRIDIVVATHERVETSGGADATYSVIQGVAGASPVAPSVTYPLKQVKLGELYIPASTSLLNASGVIWTQAEQPGIGGATDVVKTNKVQTLNKLTAFKQFAFDGWITLPIASGVVTVNDTDAHRSNLVKISDAGNISTINSTSDGGVLFFKFTQTVTIKADGNIQTPDGEDWGAIAGDVVGFIYMGASEGTSKFKMYIVPQSDMAIKSRVNRFTKRMSQNVGTPAYWDSDGKINLADDGNFYVTGPETDTPLVAPFYLKYMETLPEGTEIELGFIIGSVGYADLLHNASTVPVGYSPFYCPGGITARINNGDTLRARMLGGVWSILSGNIPFPRNFRLTEYNFVP